MGGRRERSDDRKEIDDTWLTVTHPGERKKSREKREVEKEHQREAERERE